MSNGRCQTWFGTKDSMRWIPTPNRGADFTSQSWGEGGSLLDGGGYSQHAFGSHGFYIFEWPSSSSPRVAQLMKSYRDGTYGRGLLYFVDPTMYNMNLFPPYWADPSMTVDGIPSLVTGVTPTRLATSNPGANDLPINAARYNLANVLSGDRDMEDALYIPVPEGCDLYIGATYTATGSGRIMVTRVGMDDSLQAPIELARKGTGITNLTDLIPVTTTPFKGVYVWIGKTDIGAGTVTISSMTARLVSEADKGKTAKINEARRGPWIGGQGNSGVRFEGTPTYMKNTGVNGGQVSFAATFREVGHWAYN